MNFQEIGHILMAIILLTLISGMQFAIKNQWTILILILAFSAIIISVAVFSKKFAAYLLDSDVEHEIWHISTYGFKKSNKLKKPFPAGIFFPLIISAITLGQIKLSAFLTYEARASKYRASKRFGFYSYKEMTDWHNAVIGSASTFFLLLLAALVYFSPNVNLEFLAKMSIYYAFWNILPISKLDGTQIFFGSRVLWSILFTVTLIALIMTMAVP